MSEMIYGFISFGNKTIKLGPGLGQTQKCGGVKLVNMIELALNNNHALTQVYKEELY